jgi:hypothetical protein
LRFLKLTVGFNNWISGGGLPPGIRAGGRCDILPSAGSSSYVASGNNGATRIVRRVVPRAKKFPPVGLRANHENFSTAWLSSFVVCTLSTGERGLAMMYSCRPCLDYLPPRECSIRCSPSQNSDFHLTSPHLSRHTSIVQRSK